MQWLTKNCYDVDTKDLWPPNYPDLYPLDNFVWGYVERHSPRHPHSTKARLMDSIKEVFGNMDSELVRRACGRFKGRY
uniref:Receptortype tyrosineprotein phosphatase alphalike [Hydra vulgaris] n=1 Tax=Lepeophtheirus salmonis TaxID=72036 RepID=A0A0K2TW65_LEPSM